MRLFIAIALPPEIRRHLARMQELLRPMIPARWTNPQQFHLTLKFLGETADKKLPALLAELRTVRIEQPIPLQAAGVTCFPPHGAIRIIAAAFKDESGNCRRLQGEIERACHGWGFPLEGRPWTPHVTIARAKGRLPAAARAVAVRGVESLSEEAFWAEEFFLIESRLDRQGPVYINLACIK
jgi:RNA 2',3'-cyclic 3'-phosphodiesterase